MGEATDVLLIDASLCIRCDNGEKARADTHFGTSRLDREAGPTGATLRKSPEKFLDCAAGSS